MVQFRPIPRQQAPLYSYVPIERVRPRPAAIAAEHELPHSEPRKPKSALEVQQEAIQAATLLSDLLKLVAKEFGISRGDLRAKNNRNGFVRPRQIFCFIAKTVYHKSFPQIGRAIRRDHSTVIHSVEQVRKRRSFYEPELSRLLALCPPPSPPEEHHQ